MNEATAELLREISQAGGEWQRDPARADVLEELESVGLIRSRTLYIATQEGTDALIHHDAEKTRAENEAISAKEAALDAEREAAEGKASKGKKGKSTE
mgnify:CR=1 FL=1